MKSQPVPSGFAAQYSTPIFGCPRHCLVVGEPKAESGEESDLLSPPMGRSRAATRHTVDAGEVDVRREACRRQRSTVHLFCTFTFEVRKRHTRAISSILCNAVGHCCPDRACCRINAGDGHTNALLQREEVFLHIINDEGILAHNNKNNNKNNNNNNNSNNNNNNTKKNNDDVCLPRGGLPP